MEQRYLDELRKATGVIEGWLADREAAFLYNCASRAEGGVIVEIGSFCGKSTVVLCLGSRAGNSLRVYAIDPHIGSVEQRDRLQGHSSEEIFRRNIQTAGVADLVTPIVAKAGDVGKGWDKPIALLWIDGDHSYEGASGDFELFSPWVVDGGIIAFHDCDGASVARAMYAGFSQPDYGEVGVTDTITFARKGATKSLRDRVLLVGRVYYPWIKRLPGIDAVKSPIKTLIAKQALRRGHAES
jgi:predicted O-methyltransferase YrrM